MCGIAGFNLHPSSKVNTRELAHNLLSAIETRGTHASGYAYVKGSDYGIYKNAIPGSQLPLSELPRRAQTAILHTRYSTQGHERDNRNNHPVLSPGGNIALVHNGVISNDYEFRHLSGGEFEGLPPVDTAVIPALIEKYGVHATNRLEGYAAISWLDLRGDARDTLNIARLAHSPVAFTWLTDGSFVFASTELLLATALAASNLEHGHIFDLPDETMVTVRNGVILTLTEDMVMQEDWWVRNRYSNATSGGHGGTDDTPASSYRGIGTSFGQIAFDDDDNLSYEDDDAIRSGKKAVVFDPDEVAMAYADEDNKPTRAWVSNGKGDLIPFDDDNPNDDDFQGFYTTLDDGDMEIFKDLDELENYLGWLANMTLAQSVPFPGVEPKLKWTNFVIDMGHITVKGGLHSWTENMAHIDEFESGAVYHLDYIREGVGMLIEASI